MAERTFFETLVDKALERIKTAMVEEVPSGDAFQHAFQKGRYSGLKESLNLMRQATRIDERSANGDGF